MMYDMKRKTSVFFYQKYIKRWEVGKIKELTGGAKRILTKKNNNLLQMRVWKQPQSCHRNNRNIETGDISPRPGENKEETAAVCSAMHGSFCGIMGARPSFILLY